MLKKFSFRNLFFAFILFLAVLSVFSCSSTPKTTEQKEDSVAQTETEPEVIPEPVKKLTHPYEFFDFDKEMYITLPVKGNETFITSVISKMAPGMTNFAVNQLISKMNTLYLATTVGTVSSNEKEAPLLFQFLAEGSFPTSYRNLLFTKSNGFREVNEQQGERTYNYFYNSNAKFYIDIPVNGYCFADCDYLSGMLYAYEESQKGKTFTPKWPEKAQELLLQKDDSSVIDWYMTSVKPLVSSMLGPKVKLPVSYALGTMEKLLDQPKDSMLYKVDATVVMVNSRFVNPNIPMVKNLVNQMHVKNSTYPEPIVEAGEDSEILLKGLVIDLKKIVDKIGTKDKKNE